MENFQPKLQSALGLKLYRANWNVSGEPKYRLAHKNDGSENVVQRGGHYPLVNEHGWLENGPGLKMYSLLKMGIFQPAMFVYRRVNFISQTMHRAGQISLKITMYICCFVDPSPSKNKWVPFRQTQKIPSAPTNLWKPFLKTKLGPRCS